MRLELRSWRIVRAVRTARMGKERDTKTKVRIVRRYNKPTINPSHVPKLKWGLIRQEGANL